MRMMQFSFDRYTVQSILTLIVYFRFNKRLISIQTSSLNVLFVPETYRLQHITSKSSRSKWFLQSFQLTDVSLFYFFTSTCGNTPIQTQNLHWHFFFLFCPHSWDTGTLCCVSQLLYSYSVCHESCSMWTLILQPAVWRVTGLFIDFQTDFFFFKTQRQ